MSEQVWAVMFLLVAWHFIVGPLLLCRNRCYWDVVAGLTALSIMVSGAVLFTVLVGWSIEVLTGVNLWQ